METPILFVNIAWMKRYQGDQPGDPLQPGNFGYFRTKGKKKLDGHERWNFKPVGEYVYGYAPLAEKSVNLRRLGAPAGAKEMSGVLVVFMARDPRAKLLKVVGYYEDATIRNERFEINHGEFEVRALFRARASNARIIDPPRNVVIPTFQQEGSGVGRSTLWYADAHPEKVAEVRQLVAQKNGTAANEKRKRNSGKHPRQPDTEKRLEVERRSMDLALDTFDDAEDVSKDRSGWDVEARRGQKKIFIEVKGVSGSTPLFELTPNEFAKMREHENRYILYVVTDCLKVGERAHTFEFVKKNLWMSDTGLTLSIEPMLGARCSAR